MTSPDWPHGAIHWVNSKLSIREAFSDCEQLLNVFSAAAEAVIALEGQQAGCNDIINLLTTTEELELFLWRLSRPSICFQVTVCGACSVFQSGLPWLMHVFCAYQSNNEIKEQDAVKFTKCLASYYQSKKKKRRMWPNNLLVSPGGSIKPFFWHFITTSNLRSSNWKWGTKTANKSFHPSW